MNARNTTALLLSAIANATLHGPARRPERTTGRAVVVDAYSTQAGTVRVVIEDDKELWLTLTVKEAARLRDRITAALQRAEEVTP